ncbi:MAG UNVERIFIED_CONTAM: hypothetical protein LVT10_13305 [Anaerolineae bacterium]
MNHEGVAVVGQGDAYVRFIFETVKPAIDSALRTRPTSTVHGDHRVIEWAG